MDELLVSIAFSKELCVVETTLATSKHERLPVNADTPGKQPSGGSVDTAKFLNPMLYNVFKSSTS